MGKMRLTYYAAASVTAAVAVILKAFHDRPNFYSAAVYLSQTPICYMVLLNLAMLCFGSIIYGLQLLLFGQLRIIERERLWERGWISVTETLLIMMTFRDDVGGWFLFILTNLVVARLWAWIAEGRIEMLEQQPPANPRLFHARLSVSLGVSLLLNFLFLKYCLDSVLEEARPSMMVMFAFEFAVLTITGVSNLLRYSISLREIQVVKKQTTTRIEARKAQIRAERERAQAEASANGEDESSALANLPREEDVDENDVDVPGWEEKGRWVFALDISTDFLRLVVYLAFFTILMLFHGIPIHIIRDVYMTLHSFMKRIYSFVQYRNATKDMNSRYPDATAEELRNENTCIVCREEMHQWQDPAHGGAQMEQRLRPKKLPCGHILHFGCLRSWLERQQVCPTCRRSVLAPGPTGATQGGPQPRQAPQGGQRAQGGGQALLPGQAPEGGQPPVQAQGNIQQQNNQGPNAQNQNQNQNPFGQFRGRTFNLGPIRLSVGTLQGNAIDLLRGQANAANLVEAQPQQIAGGVSTAPLAPRWDARDPASIQYELLQMERHIHREIMQLNVSQQQLVDVRALQMELARLRALQGEIQIMYQSQSPHAIGDASVGHHTAAAGPSNAAPAAVGDQSLLPPGMTLPEGWTVLPLTRTEAQVHHRPPPTVFNPAAQFQPFPAEQVAVPMPFVQPPGPFQHPPMQPPFPVPGPGQTSGEPAQPAQPAGAPLVPPPPVSDLPVPAAPATATGVTINGSSAQPVDGHVASTSVPTPSTSETLPSSSSITSANHLSTTMPTWSFEGSANGSSQTEPSTAPPHLNEGSPENAESANGSAEQRVDKGKGRAATVEDVQDDQ